MYTSQLWTRALSPFNSPTIHLPGKHSCWFNNEQKACTQANRAHKFSEDIYIPCAVSKLGSFCSQLKKILLQQKLLTLSNNNSRRDYLDDDDEESMVHKAFVLFVRGIVMCAKKNHATLVTAAEHTQCNDISSYCHQQTVTYRHHYSSSFTFLSIVETRLPKNGWYTVHNYPCIYWSNVEKVSEAGKTCEYSVTWILRFCLSSQVNQSPRLNKDFFCDRTFLVYARVMPPLQII